VELSADSGSTWSVAKILPYPTQDPEFRKKYGSDFAPRHQNTKYWCWFFWELEVEDVGKWLGLHSTKGEGGNESCIENSSMFSSDECPWELGSSWVIVRAWDSAFNTQPEKPTWNLLVCTTFQGGCYMLLL
jgi:hypothetical protein